MSNVENAKVELHPAHVWDCDECGRENFCRGIVAEMNEEEIQEMRDLGMGEEVVGKWMTAPETVKCAYCGIEFDVDFDGME